MEPEIGVKSAFNKYFDFDFDRYDYAVEYLNVILRRPYRRRSYCIETFSLRSYTISRVYDVTSRLGLGL